MILSKKFGFTLIEVLIVVAILAILSVTTVVSFSKQRTKAEDVSMKNDLNKLKIAFEEYYNDHNCYPPSEWFLDSSITGRELEPYLNKIPFNKKTAAPYVLEKDSTGCAWFKIYTTLNNEEDPQAVQLRTTDASLGSTLGNYAVSSSNVFAYIFYNPTSSSAPIPSSTPTPTPTPTSIPSPTATPTPTPNPNDTIYYCLDNQNGNPNGNCTAKPGNLTCTNTYLNDPNCGASRCVGIISTCY